MYEPQIGPTKKPPKDQQFPVSLICLGIFFFGNHSQYFSPIFLFLTHSPWHGTTPPCSAPATERIWDFPLKPNSLGVKVAFSWKEWWQLRRRGMDMSVPSLLGRRLWDGVTCHWETKKVMFCHSLNGNSVGVADLFCSNPASSLTVSRRVFVFSFCFVFRLFSRFLWWTLTLTTEIWGFRIPASRSFQDFIFLPVAPETMGFTQYRDLWLYPEAFIELADWMRRHLFSLSPVPEF